MYGGPAINIIKAYENYNTCNQLIAITRFLGETLSYATSAWAAGEIGAWDKELEELWGTQKLTSVRNNCQNWWKDNYIKPSCTEAGIQSSHKLFYLDNEILDTIVRHRLKHETSITLCAVTMQGCLLHVKEGRNSLGPMEAAAGVLQVVYNALDQIDQTDVIPDSVYIRRVPKVLSSLVCATLSYNAKEAQEAWQLLSLGDRRQLAYEVRYTDDASEIDESIVSSYDLDGAGIDWLAAFTEENEYPNSRIGDDIKSLRIDQNS